jgi:Cu(I)/Ag(I) efflux system membrane protein CusA/SilA
MQPLATPVIGGMLSSLVHILIVTPVIFAWLRERELGKGPSLQLQAPAKVP